MKLQATILQLFLLLSLTTSSFLSLNKRNGNQPQIEELPTQSLSLGERVLRSGINLFKRTDLYKNFNKLVTRQDLNQLQNQFPNINADTAKELFNKFGNQLGNLNGGNLPSEAQNFLNNGNLQTGPVSKADLPTGSNNNQNNQNTAVSKADVPTGLNPSIPNNPNPVPSKSGLPTGPNSQKTSAADIATASVTGQSVRPTASSRPSSSSSGSDTSNATTFKVNFTLAALLVSLIWFVNL